jgi:ketosteroid isomerase-like protein
MADVRELTRQYFAALERGVTGDNLAAFYDPQVVQEEFPNRLVPNGARRDLAAILAAAERGQAVITGHRYEILGIVADGDRVAVEFVWSGTLAVPVGTLGAGSVMRGRFASFLEFRGGRIVSQRSYDCFDPW